MHSACLGRTLSKCVGVSSPNNYHICSKVLSQSARTFTLNAAPLTSALKSRVRPTSSTLNSNPLPHRLWISSQSHLNASSLIASISPGEKQPHHRKSEDPFSLELADVKSLSEGIDFIENNAERMDYIGVISALEILFNLLKEEKSPAVFKDAANSVGMQKLCKGLRRYGKHMESGDLISGLKLLVLLGVPGSNATLQVVLKLLTKLANGIDLRQIVYLHFLLHKMGETASSPLSQALQFALPIVFETQLESALKEENIQYLCDYLHYASRNNLSEKSIKMIVEAILRSSDQLNYRNALSVMWSLADYKRDGPYQEPLVQNCFKHLTEAIHSCKLEELSTTLGKCVKKYLNRSFCFYNEDFLQAACDRLMSRYTDPSQTLWSFKSISLLRHVHVEYMDRIGEIIASNAAEVLNNDFLFLNLVRSFSGCNYKPEKWHRFEALLLDHPALSKDLGFQEVSLSLDFFALGTYPEMMVNKIFSPEKIPYLEEYMRRNTFNSASNLVLLYNAVKVLHPEYSGPLPPISMISKWKDVVKQANHSKKQYILRNALQTGFGGENYVVDGVYHDGLHIDHVVVMRKGGFPIAIGNKNISEYGLTEIEKPADSVIVLIKVFYNDSYSNNTNRLRGIFALEKNIVENLGHQVITVDAARWTKLPDYEKIPFLMQRIKEKIDKFQWNQSSSDVIPQ